MRRTFGAATILVLAALAAPACNVISGLDRFEVDPALGSGDAAGGGAGGTTCSTELDCPGESNECQTRACVAGRCETGPLSPGQTLGDCMRIECDGSGQPRTVVDTSDVPDDGVECTQETCSAEGAPSSAPKKQGAACVQAGGAVCDGSGKCVECNFSADCSGGGPCSGGLCVPPECTDGSKNGDESDIDCGGPDCQPCATGQGCTAITDCESKVCIAGKCVAPTCSDKVKNAEETDVDCGGPACVDCQDGKGCLTAADCTSGVCTAGMCQVPACEDGVKNGAETDVDCGGGTGCLACPSGKTCAVHADCASEACLGGTCASIVQVAAGNSFACVLLGDGKVHCWGANTQGQLGDGTVLEKLSPKQVTGLSNVTQISLGVNRVDTQGGHSCARTSDMKVSCWGRNVSGQVGDGTTVNATLPKVVNLASVVQVGAGGRHTCARLTTGAVRCWGSGTSGQLGNGGTVNASAPAAAVANVVAIGLATGDAHNCAVLQTGEVRCWGDNASGQLGIGTIVDKPTATLVPNLLGISKMAAGNRFTCAIGGTSLHCFGFNAGGQLGLGNTTQQLSPVLVPNLNDVMGVSAGTDATLGGHSCVVLAGGALRCFGANTRGELGNGDKVNQSTPQAINIPPVAEVALGLQFTCARLVSGTVRCWGRNDLGQLGIGTKGADQLTPVPVVFP